MFWVFLGPVCLLFTLLAAAAVGSVIAPLCTLLTLPILWRWQWRAVLPAAILTFLIVSLSHQHADYYIAAALAAVYGLLIFSYDQFLLLNPPQQKDLPIDQDNVKPLPVEQDNLIKHLQNKIDAVKKINKELDGENYLGKYKQLREQFQQKSNLLDKTRQELFHANEEISRLQRLLEEKEDEILTEIHETLANQEDEEHSSMEEEVLELRQLVASLMK